MPCHVPFLQVYQPFLALQVTQDHPKVLALRAHPIVRVHTKVEHPMCIGILLLEYSYCS